MPKLPVVSGRELVKALERAGFEFIRQRGSHGTMISRQRGCSVVVPVHGNKDLPKGPLAGNSDNHPRQSGMIRCPQSKSITSNIAKVLTKRTNNGYNSSVLSVVGQPTRARLSACAQPGSPHLAGYHCFDTPQSSHIGVSLK